LFPFARILLCCKNETYNRISSSNNYSFHHLCGDLFSHNILDMIFDYGLLSVSFRSDRLRQTCVYMHMGLRVRIAYISHMMRLSNPYVLYMKYHNYKFNYCSSEGFPSCSFSTSCTRSPSYQAVRAITIPDIPPHASGIAKVSEKLTVKWIRLLDRIPMMRCYPYATARTKVHCIIHIIPTFHSLIRNLRFLKNTSS
jgi:hypothetical protein